MKVFATSLLVVILGATLSSACTEGDTAPIDGKCREYQVCKNGTWEKESCNTPMRKYSKEQKKCLWWFQVDCSEERQCNNEEAILKNPYTCSSYYKCKNGKLEANNCWWPFFYDGETGCKFWGNCHSSEVVGGNTDKTELYADPCENDESEPIANHCFWYKTCGTDGFFKQTRCSLGKYFDAANKTCDWFWSVSCDVSTCDGKPRADPGSDGKFYYQCIDGFLMKKSCGPLRKFDATQEKCVFDFQAMTPNVSKLISESPKQSLLVSTVNDKPVETNPKVVESLQTKQNRSNVSIKRVVRSIMLANCNNGERTFDKDCYKFRECDQGVWVTKECPPGMLYSKTECRWIGDAVCDEGACIAGQSTAYPTDCTLYYKCNPATHDKEVEDCGRVIWKRHYNPQTHQCYLPGFWDTACPATAAS